MSAFLIVLLPEQDGEPPKDEAHYPLTDPYYACDEVRVCGCPLALGQRFWKVKLVTVGGMFDGRVKGISPSRDWEREGFDRLWSRNLTRPLEMVDPVSAFAVVTPNGLWHECVRPEPQDLWIGQRPSPDWRGLNNPQRILTTSQTAWRSEVADLLTRYQHCWALGCDATLSSQASRHCDEEAWLALRADSKP